MHQSLAEFERHSRLWESETEQEISASRRGFLSYEAAIILPAVYWRQFHENVLESVAKGL